ncbi:MAG: membrane protein insertase YidC [Flavobacteriales bacterium]|nr:membrane protein insertase YidC [Flavobacteriales bacterium]MBT5354392.1 membrane protein insertase YidC [Flavobacteriales bacterium]
MQKQDNKSTLTGLVLIGIIFVAYSIFFPYTPEETPNKEEPNVLQGTTKIEVKTIPKNTSEDNLPKENSTKDIIDSTKIVTEEFYTLENDKIKLVFTNKGGEIKSAIIKGFYTYDEYKKNPEERKDIEIFNNQDSKFEISADRNVSTNEFFSVQKTDKSIIFKKDYEKGVFIEYIYTLNGEEENFVDLTINTEGISNPELIWTIAAPETEKSKTNQELGTGFYYQEEHSKDVDYTWDNDEFEINEFETDLSWISFTQQFFSTIIEAKNNNFNSDTKLKSSKNENDEYVKTLSLKTTLKNGENNYSIYFGENDYKKLKGYDKSFEEIIPLGWGIFGWVNRVAVIPIFDFLKNSAGLTNFGLIILILTLIIKLSLSPLTYKSYLSQAKMKVLKPEIDKINEKHKEKDPMKAQKETMGLYRKAGVNPMGGCLPMLVQFPILIAMFRFFPASMELRQKSFLWADDLSSYDSIMSLPWDIPFYGDHVSLFTLMMTVSTLIYTHMNSQMTSNQMPGMKWMMYLMPIMFLGFFNSYASSLSYYYFLANVFTFSQMYFMRRFVDDDKLLAQLEENKKKPKKKSKFQKKLEEMQKKQEQQMKKRKKK